MGPHGFLYVSDETLNKIFRLYPDGHREELISLGDPDGSTFDQQLHLLDCASVLRAMIRIDPDGHYTVLAGRYQNKRFNSPNDLVIGPDGAIYFTDPTLDLPKGQPQEIPFQGVYRLDAKGEVRLLTRDLAQPNGLAFSPDGKHFYVDDSERLDIRVYDFLPGATLANGRQFGTEKGGPDEGVPDGMRVDMQGNLFVVGPLGIWVWDPAGHHLGTIVLPEQPANLTWGSPTTARCLLPPPPRCIEYARSFEASCPIYPKAVDAQLADRSQLTPSGRLPAGNGHAALAGCRGTACRTLLARSRDKTRRGYGKPYPYNQDDSRYRGPFNMPSPLRTAVAVLACVIFAVLPASPAGQSAQAFLPLCCGANSVPRLGCRAHVQSLGHADNSPKARWEADASYFRRP